LYLLGVVKVGSTLICFTHHMQIRATDLSHAARMATTELKFHLYGRFGTGLDDGLGLGLGDAPGDGSGDGLAVGLGLGLGLPLGLGLGLGFGLDLGVGLGLGVCVGSGLSVAVGTVAGLSVGAVAGADGIAASAFEVLVFFVLRVGPGFTSLGAGPASAGLATCVPTAAGTPAPFILRFATVRPGVKLHGCTAASTEVNVSLSLDLLPLSEITLDVASSPI